MYDFDLFVIGAGSGGVRAARTAAAYGAKVAIAEDRYLGGTCVNVGCIPKKLYSMASHYQYDYEDSAGFGWKVEKPQFDWQRLKSNKQTEIRRLNAVYENLLRNSGVQLLQARATLADAHTVIVNGERITAHHILIATGAWPHVPQVPGREYVVTSNEIFDLPEFPQRILIVGGGYIATEFAGIFAGLGADTILVYRGERPLKGFDEDVRRHYFAEAGRHVRMLMQSDVESIDKAGQSLRVTMTGGAALEVSAVLFATGRRPHTEGLGLENTGVRLRDDGGIRIDQHFVTDEPSIHAIGDVAGPIALTPVALAEGMYVANRLFGDRSRTVSYENVPTAVFSHPNIGTIGLGEEAAHERHGERVVVFESEFRELRHTLSGRQERTYMKLVVDGSSDRVLGMHMVGANAGEIIQGFAAAMTCGVTKSQLDATIGIHPTVAEEFVTMRTARKTT